MLLWVNLGLIFGGFLGCVGFFWFVLACFELFRVNLCLILEIFDLFFVPLAHF